MRWLLAGLLLGPTALADAGVRAIVPPQASPLSAVGTPGVDAGGYLYVSGQGPRRPDGTTPPTFVQQARQALENVRRAVETAGLTMENVVYLQVYLEDTRQQADLDSVCAEVFPKSPPARAVLGVARVPEPPIEIAAVAAHDLSGKRAVSPAHFPPSRAYSPGMLTHDRLFVSAMPGSDPSSGQVPGDAAAQVDLALDRLRAVVEAGGLTLSHMVFVNPYLTREIPMRTMNDHYAGRFEFGNTPARATIQVSSLPEGVHIAYTGVAVRDLGQRRPVRPKNMPPSPTASPCVFAGDTLYCSAKSGFIPGPNGGVYASTTSHQVRQTMRNLLDNLEEAEMNFDQVVSTTVYLDDLSDVGVFEKTYGEYFKGHPPSQTTVQQIQPAERKPDEGERYPDLEQVSLIAVRRRP